MNLVDGILEIIPGFYSVVLLTTVWLMLPMFRGADRVFRQVLVPALGMQAALIKHDAARLAKDIMSKLPHDKRQVLSQEVAALFLENEGANGGAKQNQ